MLSVKWGVTPQKLSSIECSAASLYCEVPHLSSWVECGSGVSLRPQSNQGGCMLGEVDRDDAVVDDPDHEQPGKTGRCGGHTGPPRGSDALSSKRFRGWTMAKMSAMGSKDGVPSATWLCTLRSVVRGASTVCSGGSVGRSSCCCGSCGFGWAACGVDGGDSGSGFTYCATGMFAGGQPHVPWNL
eukprot:2226353-Rhodomonas_salina.4